MRVSLSPRGETVPIRRQSTMKSKKNCVLSRTLGGRLIIPMPIEMPEPLKSHLLRMSVEKHNIDRSGRRSIW